MSNINNTIDNCLTKKNNHLYIEGCDTIDLIKEYGSPLFVMSENQMRCNIQSFQKAIHEGWNNGTVKVLPVVKANWITAIQKIVASEGCGCDTYSANDSEG
jgi:diaminopimelate decarboxylase